MYLFIITNHARERIKERVGECNVNRLVRDAWYDGKTLSEKQQLYQFVKNLSTTNPISSEYRKYKKQLFVFYREGRTVTLLTVHPFWNSRPPLYIPKKKKRLTRK